jgi:hypothetical protein
MRRAEQNGLLPFGRYHSLQIGCPNARITSNDGHSEIQRCRSYDAVGHFWHVSAGNLSHRFNHLSRECGFLEDVIGVSECSSQIVVGRCGQATLFDKVTTSARLMEESATLRRASAALSNEAFAAAESRRSANKNQSAA